MRDMSLTVETSHPEMSPSKMVAPANMRDISETRPRSGAATAL